MKSHTALVSVLLGMAATISGCLSASTVEPMRYYTLTPMPAVEAVASSGRSLGIRPLMGAKPYKAAIAFTAEDHRLAYFKNAEWADLPAAMVNRALSDGLVRLGAFTEVDDAANMKRPSLILTGELRRFEADFNRETPVAVVEVSCVLRNAESGESLWQGLLNAETPFTPAPGDNTGRNTDATLAAVANAMSDAVSRLVEQACTAIGGVL